MSEVIFERMRGATAKRVQRTNDKVAATLKAPLSPKKAVGDIGLELEIEGDNLPDFIDYLSPETATTWFADKDGSLRGENHEYITNDPIKVAETQPMCQALFDAFKERGSVLRLSNRCSTHVHVNCSTLTARPITSLIALYAIVEEAVTHWCGDERISNPFCLRMIDASSTIENWQLYLEEPSSRGRGGGHPDDRGPFPRGDKYNALNLKPLFEQGSVEFRALRGVDDPDTVVKWVNFLWALREEARTTYQNPERLAQQVSAMGVVGVITEIIEKYDLGLFWLEVVNHPLNEGQIERMLRRGFLLIQPLLFAINWAAVADREEVGEAAEDYYARQAKEARIRQHEERRARLNPQPVQLDAGLAMADEAEEPHPARNRPRRVRHDPLEALAAAENIGWAEPVAFQQEVIEGEAIAPVINEEQE